MSVVPDKSHPALGVLGQFLSIFQKALMKT